MSKQRFQGWEQPTRYVVYWHNACRERDFAHYRAAEVYAQRVLGEVYERVNVTERRNADNLPLWEWNIKEVVRGQVPVAMARVVARGDPSPEDASSFGEETVPIEDFKLVATPTAEYIVRCVPLERVTALEAEVERLRARVAQLEAARQARQSDATPHVSGVAPATSIRATRTCLEEAT